MLLESAMNLLSLNRESAFVCLGWRGGRKKLLVALIACRLICGVAYMKIIARC